MRLLKCGLINCANTQPTQGYSWNFNVAVLSEHFPYWLNSCVDISLLLVSHVNTKGRKKQSCTNSISVWLLYTTHTSRQAVIHSADRLSPLLLCAPADVWSQPHPCDPVNPSVFLKVEVDICVFRPFVSQCFL